MREERRVYQQYSLPFNKNLLTFLIKLFRVTLVIDIFCVLYTENIRAKPSSTLREKIDKYKIPGDDKLCRQQGK